MEKKPYQGSRGEVIDPSRVDVYRGSTSFEVELGQVRVGPDGMVKSTHGLSLNTDPNTPAVALRGANKIKSVPEELQIIQRGQQLTHFELVPKKPMPLRRYQELVRQVILEKV